MIYVKHEPGELDGYLRVTIDVAVDEVIAGKTERDRVASYSDWVRMYCMVTPDQTPQTLGS